MATMLTSRFSKRSFIVLFILGGACVILSLIAETILRTRSVPPFGIIVFTLLFTFIFIWIFFGELRKRAVKVTITEQNISWRNFYGLGIRKNAPLQECNGFEVRILRVNDQALTDAKAFEYLALFVNGKKRFWLSEFYHSNYFDLKAALIARNIKFLYRSKSGILSELKEIIT